MIEYLHPSSGGNNLSYNIKQAEFYLTNADLTKLNSQPFELITQGNYISLLNFTVLFNSNNGNSGQNMYIGFEPLLNATYLSYQGVIDLQYVVGQSGCISLAAANKLFWISNNMNTSPLILWQQTDDSAANYSLFRIIITYIQI